MLEEREREILRVVAGVAAKRAMGLPSPAPPEIAEGSVLRQRAPVFVTWMRDGHPRGRSGTISPEKPLVAEVGEHAAAALLRDPRFAPATARELPRHVPEISILASFEEIPGAEVLVPGTHGVVVEKGKRRGVVLPQDAALFKGDGPRILAQACLRAGLPEESWKAARPPRLLRFTAEVF